MPNQPSLRPEELSSSAVAHKLHYLKGGIAGWLHEARSRKTQCGGYVGLKGVSIGEGKEIGNYNLGFRA